MAKRADWLSAHQYTTEMLHLDIIGSSFRLRESPTLASIGGTTIEIVPGGFAVESHFTVNLELSTNGGSTWIPASSELLIGTVPEPATMCLLGLGGLLLRRKK